MLLLAAIDLDKLLPQLIFVLFLVGSALRSVFANRKAEQRTRRGRPSPQPRGEESLEQEALNLELLEQLRQLEEQTPSVPAPVEPGEGEELAVPLGLDLAEVEGALPSRQEDRFESHQLGLEGQDTLPALQERKPRPRRRTHREHLGSPATLRRAIITAELLGPPVALRDDSLTSARS
jgi:hypothetical protein